MESGFELIPLTLMIAILGWFGFAALSGSRTLFKQKHYFAALCALILAAIWLSVVGTLITQVYIAWIVVGFIGGSIFLYSVLDDRKKDILKSIFGWCCILLMGTAFWVLFIQ